MTKKLFCTLICLNGICWASVEPYTSPLLRGQIAVKAADGSWKGSRSLAAGEWAQSKSGDTTLSVPGATLRAESGTKVRYTVQDGALHLDAQGGRVFVAMKPGQSGVPCTVAMGERQVHVSRGEFVVDATTGLLSVVSGDAAISTGNSPDLAPVKSWTRVAPATLTKTQSLQERSRHLGVADSSDALISSSLDSLSQGKDGLAPISAADGGLLGATPLELTASDLALDEAGQRAVSVAEGGLDDATGTSTPDARTSTPGAKADEEAPPEGYREISREIITVGVVSVAVIVYALTNGSGNNETVTRRITQ